LIIFYAPFGKVGVVYSAIIAQFQLTVYFGATAQSWLLIRRAHGRDVIKAFYAGFHTGVVNG
jgi:hypothetical protein